MDALSPEIRKGVVGGMLAHGEVVLTATGRKTTAFPKLDTTNNRKTVNTCARVDAWLRENAIEEALARGDRFNLRSFESENPKCMPEATKSSMEEYLFGDFVPPIPRPFLRPLI